jgi:long-subunit fatty acid transport protein
MGMGGAFIGVADDATAASWNPGGLLQLIKPEISIVGSFYSGGIDYKTSGIDGDMEDYPLDIHHLNYLSAAIPFLLIRRNFVFSLNYQHLYEFSRENFSSWREVIPDAGIDIHRRNYKSQKGSLSTVSPALAFQVNPSFYMGFTFNFWDHDILDNGWENINIQDAEGFDLGGGYAIEHSEVFERYDFSGFNMHIGFMFKSDYFTMWGKKRKCSIGWIIKTPFDAKVSYERMEIGYEEYPEDPSSGHFKEVSILSRELILKMPLSYGLGFSLDLSDSLTLALDVYRTRWDRYVLKYPSGDEMSPVNKKDKDDADVRPTTQVRLGTEYLFQKPGRIIPVRAGIFYDPEPSSGRPDDIFGVSLGSGISYKELFSLDFVYQFRFGHKKEAESLQGVDVSGRIAQHYFYASMIYYLF